MLKLNLFATLLVVSMSFQNVCADDDISSALQKTQDCLRNQNCDSMKTNTGMEADQKALEAVGGNAKQELYNIAADVLPILIQQTEGDPKKMEAMMLKAQTDPESFLNSLPPDMQAKIKNVANGLKNQAPSQTP
ncbi:hypothetical protein [Methylobacter svalbardensis]|uniref:hypothetical protein n=1 Tax=Methylobacter svalbardensis TaxID=3080016 RepID=UPI0030EDC223